MSKITAKKKMIYIGACTCDVCEEQKNDVIKLKTGWFTSINICDGCCSVLFRSYKKGVGGGNGKEKACC